MGPITVYKCLNYKLLSCNIRVVFLKRIACLGSAMRPSKSGLHTVTIMPLSPAMQMLGAFAEFERAMCSELRT